MKATIWSSFQLDPQSKVEWSKIYEGKYKECLQYCKDHQSDKCWAEWIVYPKKCNKKHPIISFWRGQKRSEYVYTGC